MNTGFSYTHIIPNHLVQAERVRIAAVLAAYNENPGEPTLLELTIGVVVWKFCEVLKKLNRPYQIASRSMAPDGSVEVTTTFQTQADLDLIKARMLARRSPWTARRHRP